MWKTRKEWDEYVSKADTKLIKIAWDYRPIGKRSIGKPQKRWAQSWIFLEEILHDKNSIAWRKTWSYAIIKEEWWDLKWIETWEGRATELG